MKCSFFFGLRIFMVASCLCFQQLEAQPLPISLNLAENAPDSFLVSFETTKGSFIMKSVRNWSPLGVDRLYILAKNGYYNNNVIYRVAPTMSFTGGFVVQFGVGNSGAVIDAWEKVPIKDEPVRQPHKKGSVSFARGAPDTRTVELAISLSPTTAFDTVNYNGVRGFPTIAEVVEGMPILELLNRQYGNSVFNRQDSIALNGGEYLKRAFPNLDRIISVSVIKTW
jgi:peptidyl-prolyl cis-trans isomerase A (cyclophilin A)